MSKFRLWRLINVIEYITYHDLYYKLFHKSLFTFELEPIFSFLTLFLNHNRHFVITIAVRLPSIARCLSWTDDWDAVTAHNTVLCTWQATLLCTQATREPHWGGGKSKHEVSILNCSAKSTSGLNILLPNEFLYITLAEFTLMNLHLAKQP